MRHLPVHWSEGMFLRPHHFQAADRYWTDLVQTSESWDHAYNYGLRRIELSEEAIANYQFQLDQCHARMKDGTIVSIEAGEEPDRIDLKDEIRGLQGAMANLEEAFDQEPVLQVYLAVPRLKLGNANVVSSEGAGKHRFVARAASFQDESAGGNDRDVDQRQLNVRILLSTEDLTGYELLPIAQIRRAGEQEAVPEIDPSYIPPVLAIDAWRPLGRDIVRSIYDYIGQKIDVLREQIAAGGAVFEGRDPGDLDRIFLLTTLNAAYCTLGQLCLASGIHPLQAYVELCRIVGMLSIFADEHRPPDLPAYDHDDLARIFQYVRLQIETLISRVPDRVFEQQYFEGAGLGMQVTLKPHWFHNDWEWFVGVDKGSLTQDECRALLSPQLLDWKLASSARVERIFTNAQSGLALVAVDRVPRAFPGDGNWIYYSVSRDSPEWTDVQKSQTLAMRLKDNIIVNRDKLQGANDIIVRVGGRQATLRFALFALPSPS